MTTTSVIQSTFSVKRSHISELVFPKSPKDANLAETWRKQVVKSRSDDFNPVPGAQGTYVCSNHFPLGKRTSKNPEADYPSVFLTLSEYFHSNTPKNGRRNRREEERSYNPRPWQSVNKMKMPKEQHLTV